MILRVRDDRPEAVRDVVEYFRYGAPEQHPPSIVLQTDSVQ